MTDLPTLAGLGLFLILILLFLAGAVLFRIVQRQFAFKSEHVTGHDRLYGKRRVVSEETVVQDEAPWGIR